MSVAKGILDRIGDNRPRRVTCVTVSPLTINIDGDTSVALPALLQSGSTFAVGESGFAFWYPPLPPICFKAT